MKQLQLENKEVANDYDIESQVLLWGEWKMLLYRNMEGTGE